MAIYKQNRLMLPLKEFLIIPTQTRYEITDLDMTNVVVFYRKFASNLTILESYSDMPKGYYRIIEESGAKYLEINEQEVLTKYYSIQLCREMNRISSEYNPTGDIDVNRLLEHTNELVEDMSFIFGYIKNISVIADSISAVKVTSELRPLTTWYMDENGMIATIPVSELFEKFDEMVQRVYEEVLALLTADYNKFSAQLLAQFKQHSQDLNTLHENITDAINALSAAEQKAIKDLADAREDALNTLADAREAALTKLADDLEKAHKAALDAHKEILAQQLTDLKNQLAQELQDLIDIAVGDRGVPPENSDWFKLLRGNWTILDALNSGYINIPPMIRPEDKSGFLNYTVNEAGTTGVLRYYTTSKKVYFAVQINGVWSEWQVMDNGKTELTFTQAGHGFIMNTVNLDANGLWVLADKEVGASAIAFGIDADRFNIVYSGYTKLPTAARDSKGNTYVTGEYYFMSPYIDGAIQRDKPSEKLFQPVLQVVLIDGVQYARVDVEEPHDMTQRLLTEESAGEAGLALQKDLEALETKVANAIKTIPEVTQDIPNGTDKNVPSAQAVREYVKPVLDDVGTLKTDMTQAKKDIKKANEDISGLTKSVGTNIEDIASLDQRVSTIETSGGGGGGEIPSNVLTTNSIAQAYAGGAGMVPMADDTKNLDTRVNDIEQKLPNPNNPYGEILTTGNIKFSLENVNHDWDIVSGFVIKNMMQEVPNKSTSMAINETGNTDATCPTNAAVYRFYQEMSQPSIDRGKIKRISADAQLAAIDLLTLIESSIGLEFNHKSGIYSIKEEGEKKAGYVYTEYEIVDGRIANPKLYKCLQDTTSVNNDATLFQPIYLDFLSDSSNYYNVQSGEVVYENKTWYWEIHSNGTLILRCHITPVYKNVNPMNYTIKLPTSFIDSNYSILSGYSTTASIYDSFSSCFFEVYNKKPKEFTLYAYNSIAGAEQTVGTDILLIGRWKNFDEMKPYFEIGTSIVETIMQNTDYSNEDFGTATLYNGNLVENFNANMLKIETPTGITINIRSIEDGNNGEKIINYGLKTSDTAISGNVKIIYEDFKKGYFTIYEQTITVLASSNNNPNHSQGTGN